MNSESERIIREELSRFPGKKKISGSDIDIQCPFHQENTPSCGVYVVPNGKLPFGFFHCLGCGASGLWNKLAEKANLRTVKQNDKPTSTDRDSNEAQKLRDTLLPPKGGNVVMPYGIEFDDKEWRGIDGDLVRKIGGILGFDPVMKIACLYMPVSIDKKLVAYIKAALIKKRGALSYLITGKLIEEGLFPYNYVRKMLGKGKYRYLVIVEGPRDALFLIQHGIPAIAILGTRAWSARKRRIITRLCIANDAIPLVMMDCDKADKQGKRAGQSAQARIIADFQLAKVAVSSIPLEKYARQLKVKELDPATLPLKLVKKIKKLCRRKK